MISENIIFVLIATISTTETTISNEADPLRSLPLFSTKFYNTIRIREGNLLISPLAINHALAASSFGAEKITLYEMRQALELSTEQVGGTGARYTELDISSAYKKLSASIQDEYLKVSTSIFVDEQFEFTKEFEISARDYFSMTIERYDFVKRAEKSRLEINRRVSKETDGKIIDIVQKEHLDVTILSIILSGVYFNASTLFPSYGTKKGTFFGMDKNYEVDMMEIKRPIERGECSTIDAHYFGINFESGYKLLIVVPKSKKGLNKVEEKLMIEASVFYETKSSSRRSIIDKIFLGLEEESIDLTLPKFTFEQSHDLRPTLEKMNLKKMFSPEANLSRMAKSNSSTPLSISKVIQKTVIDLNPSGSQSSKVGKGNLKPFIIDYPFIYIIQHKKYDVPLIIGRVMHP